MTTTSAPEKTSDESTGSSADRPLIRRLKISGMLSFGPRGIDLPMEPLNVFIGPNGSGKSNLIEALALLRAAPHNLPEPVKAMGGISEWLWKGDNAPDVATIDAVVNYPEGIMPLRHVLEIVEHGERFEVVDERIENEQPQGSNPDPYFFYRFQRGNPVINDSSGERRGLRRETVRPEESILSQRDDPDHYPALYWLKEQYGGIRLYRNWQFGPAAPLRKSPNATERSDFLSENGENLALVLSRFRGDTRRDFIKSLAQLYEGAENFQIAVDGGSVSLFIEESGGRSIPASRLSDGTLRYMALAAILLDPDPPPLVVIEEPELGLHPDVVLGIGEMLIQASERTQLVVTTHSRVLINALEDHASSVVVCEKRDGQSQMKRLDSEQLEVWLEKYSLGYLWSIGELGGNRW